MVFVFIFGFPTDLWNKHNHVHLNNLLHSYCSSDVADDFRLETGFAFGSLSKWSLCRIWQLSHDMRLKENCSTILCWFQPAWSISIYIISLSPRAAGAACLCLAFFRLLSLSLTLSLSRLSPAPTLHFAQSVFLSLFFSLCRPLCRHEKRWIVWEWMSWNPHQL